MSTIKESAESLRKERDWLVAHIRAVVFDREDCFFCPACDCAYENGKPCADKILEAVRLAVAADKGAA